MSTCLGLYIENNLIKYAKVTKEHDQVKVETFGTKFYDNLDHAVKQIVEETYSYKIPISINLSEEFYNYFNIFALLSKKDLPKAIKTEFESYCADKNYNPNVFETRYAITKNTQEKDKLKVIHVSENKIELNKQLQTFSQYELQNIAPVSMTISDVTEFKEKENVLIVNIEEKTIITKILDQKIYDIDILDMGSQEILDKINVKENSYQKSYEICKETTIYTSQGKGLNEDEEEINYLENIMPTLYNIVDQVRKIINESFDRIDKVYITGTGALINNVDLYFEEYLRGIKCEILKPNFVKISPEINIKDYVEVNTAISLALNGLGQGITGMNFKRLSFMDKLPDFLKMEIGTGNKNKKIKTNKVSEKFKGKKLALDFNIPLDKVEKSMLRGAGGVLALFIIYSVYSNILNNQIEEKMKLAEESIINTNAQIQIVENDKNKIIEKTNEYITKIANLQEVNQQITNNNKVKKSIPILLNKLINIMPTGVQVTSIQNTKEKHIVIQAQAMSYDQLGYLTSSLRLQNVLTNLLISTPQMSNNIITIQIEGDLP